MSPHHDRTSRIIRTGRPDVQREAVLALWRRHRVEYASDWLRANGRELERIDDALPRPHRHGSPEPQSPSRLLGEADAAKDTQAVLDEPPHPTHIRGNSDGLPAFDHVSPSIGDGLVNPYSPAQ